MFEIIQIQKSKRKKNDLPFIHITQKSAGCRSLNKSLYFQTKRHTHTTGTHKNCKSIQFIIYYIFWQELKNKMKRGQGNFPKVLFAYIEAACFFSRTLLDVYISLPCVVGVCVCMCRRVTRCMSCYDCLNTLFIK